MLVDLDGTRAVLDAVADQVIDEMPEAVPDAHEAATHGAVILREKIREAMDLDQWEDGEISPKDGAQKLADDFCYAYCPHGQRDQPGEHPRCDACPLSEITTKALARQVARAKEGG